jgi:plasmid stabilization system protein ParE
MYFLVLDDKVQNQLLYISQNFTEAREQQFVQVLRNCFDTMLEHPLAMPSIGFDAAFPNLAIRKMLLTGFSYGLLYIVLEAEEIVRVVACYHVRSDPETWLQQ